MTETLSAVVLAAGKGTRMRNTLPKVLHRVAGRPLVGHAMETTRRTGCSTVVLVLAEGSASVEAAARAVIPDLHVAIQDPPLGTGHAVMAALDALPMEGSVVVLFGDTPLLEATTVRRLVQVREEHDAAVAVLGMRPPESGGYGRLRMGDGGELLEIVEHRHAGDDLLSSAACNSGVMAIDAAELRPLLDAVACRPENGEYYLTDIVAIARSRGRRCTAIETAWQEGHGVNSQAQLAEAEELWQRRRRQELHDSGVIMPAPETVQLAVDCRIAPGATLEPQLVFGPGVVIEEGAVIRSFCHLEGAHIGAGVVVGPFARLRPGTHLESGARIGNFVETKNARLGEGAKANHLTYLGDCSVGHGANIGAGTITCNYDGFSKHRTEIGAGAFVGSNTAIVAPLRVGEGAIIGAGSAITKDVPDNAIAVARGEQGVRTGMAATMRQRLRAKREAKNG